MSSPILVSQVVTVAGKTYNLGLGRDFDAEVLKAAGELISQAANLKPIGQPAVQRLSTSAIIAEYLIYKADGGAVEGYLKVRARKLHFFARQYPELPTIPEPIHVYLRQFRTDNVPTRQDQWKALSDLYKYAAKEYHIPNPMLEVEKPHFKKKPGKRLSHDEAKAFLTAVKTDLEWAIVTGYFGLRLRGIEAERLRSGDIRSDFITVWDGKERTEELPLLPLFREKLMAVGNGREPTEPHFGMKESTLSYHIEQVGQRVGLHVTPRVLRNTAAALWYYYDGDKSSNRLLLRHSTEDMTDHYSNEFLDELRLKDERHNPMLNLMRELGLVPNYQNTSSAPPLSPGVVSVQHRYWRNPVRR
jgi:integrase